MKTYVDVCGCYMVTVMDEKGNALASDLWYGDKEQASAFSKQLKQAVDERLAKEEQDNGTDC